MGDRFRENVFFSISLNFEQYELYREYLTTRKNLKQQKVWAKDKIV